MNIKVGTIRRRLSISVLRCLIPPLRDRYIVLFYVTTFIYLLTAVTNFADYVLPQLNR